MSRDKRQLTFFMLNTYMKKTSDSYFVHTDLRLGKNSLFGNSFIDKRTQDVDIIVRVFGENVWSIWAQVN